MDRLQELYSITTLVTTAAVIFFIIRYIMSMAAVQSYMARSNVWKNWEANGKFGKPPEWHQHLCNKRLECSKELMFFTFVQAVMVSLSIFGVFRRAIVVDILYPAIIGGFFALFAFCFCLLATVIYMDICHTNEVDGEEPYYRLTSDKDKGQIYRALYGALVCSILAATFFNFAGMI